MSCPPDRQTCKSVEAKGGIPAQIRERKYAAALREACNSADVYSWITFVVCTAFVDELFRELPDDTRRSLCNLLFYSAFGAFLLIDSPRRRRMNRSNEYR